jgi:amino acid transporter
MEGEMTQSAGGSKMSVRGAAFLGVGSMVGAGIFALLGEAGAVAGSAVWVSFLLGGLVAGLLGYVVAKLGARYPSSGGIVTFLVEAFGTGRITGIVSWLLYFAALIITAMVAVSFGSYATALFFGDNASAIWDSVFTTGVIVLVAAINIIGGKLIDRVQSVIVVILLVVFGGFIVATMGQMDIDLLARSTYPPAMDIASSVALTFFAYLGFAVISYAGGDLPNPERNLPKAMYLALGIATLLYILISIGVFGTLTVEEVIQNGETALAEAARPVLGDAGFAMMAIAALLATSSSANANVYGAVGTTSKLAEVGQFPPGFGRTALLHRGTRGLTISVLAVLLLANLVDLTAIASLGSVVALAIFLVVAVVGWRLKAETGSQAWLIVTAFVSTASVLLIFVVDTLQSEPETFTAMIGLLALSALLEFIWTWIRNRRAASGATPAAGEGSSRQA